MEAASESLLEALAVFYHANVGRAAEIVLAGTQQNVMIDLADVYYSSRTFHNSEEFLKLALRMGKPQGYIWSNLGVLLVEQRRPDEAEQAFRQALAADPKYDQAWSNLGTLYRVTGRFVDAQAALAQAVQLSPQEAIDHAALGAVLRKLGRQDDAERAFARALALSQTESLYNQAYIAALCGDAELAYQRLEAALNDGDVSREWVRQDPDWEDYRVDVRYLRLISG